MNEDERISAAAIRSVARKLSERQAMTADERISRYRVGLAMGVLETPPSPTDDEATRRGYARGVKLWEREYASLIVAIDRMPITHDIGWCHPDVCDGDGRLARPDTEGRVR